MCAARYDGTRLDATAFSVRPAVGVVVDGGRDADVVAGRRKACDSGALFIGGCTACHTEDFVEGGLSTGGREHAFFKEGGFADFGPLLFSALPGWRRVREQAGRIAGSTSIIS